MALTIGSEAVASVEATLAALKSHSQDFVLDMSPVESTSNAPEASEDTIDTAASSMLLVVGHRGCGKNKVLPSGVAPEARASIRENTITSFNLAARNGAQFVEFDVQVTKDGVPIIFHDDVIISEGRTPTHIGELTLEEFRAMGPQSDPNKAGLALFRKAVDGSIALWTADVEDYMCTLEEAFTQVEATAGFNIELKFDDDGSTTMEELHRVIDAVLEDVRKFSNGRMIYFSSFHPDAVLILRTKMSKYPVFFLTNGGGQTYNDARRNSIEAAIQVCHQGNLQGIVSEVKPVLQNPAVVQLVKEQGLFFFTYGELK
ncbi:hypothetical protein M758_1G282300 [Ceratodon purpureus]|nr:hypothetical protein M758_1G282300 [Ceratodon purpureus]